jgi:hypothetical protein
MSKNTLTLCIRNPINHKRRAGAEVISSVLLVAITVVGAVILTSFLDETFVAGSLGASSSSDSVIKSVKLIGFDTRDGGHLMNIQTLNNTSLSFPSNQNLCRVSCTQNTSPTDGGTQIMVIQIENTGVNPIFLHNIYLDSVDHVWDISTAGKSLDTEGTFIAGNFPGDGSFSITPSDIPNPTQREDNQIQNGETVNLIIKLDNYNDDVPLSKTIRAQFNIGANQLSEVLIESGGAQ